MKFKLLFLFLLLFLFSPNVILGYGCDTADKVRYRNEASNVSIKYIDKIENEKIEIEILITNLTKDIYVKMFGLELGTEGIDFHSNNEIGTTYIHNIKNVKQGHEYKFLILPEDSFCSGESLNVIILKVPFYNEFYNNKICENYKEFSLCQKWTYQNVTYETLEEEIKKIKNEDNSDSEADVKDNYYGLVEMLIDYWYYVLGIIIFIGITIVLILNKKNKERMIK